MPLRSRFLSKKLLIFVFITVVALSLGGASLYFFSQKQASISVLLSQFYKSKLYKKDFQFENEKTPSFSAQNSPELLLDSARLAGDYLVRSVKAHGKFVYIYKPQTNKQPHKYNILRHAGTIYAMMELYQVTGDEDLFESSKRAIEYLLSVIKPCPADDNAASCVVKKGYTKLGGNALAVIALAKYTEVTGDRQYMPVIQNLGLWIQAAQVENGRFAIQKQSYPEGENTAFVSAYYPGEALLALSRLYALDPDEKWLDSAEKGAVYLINIRDGDLPDSRLPHDHWLLYALNDLYRYRQNPLYLKHSLRLANVIVKSQNRNPEHRNWLGSYYHPPRSTPTATRTEGLCSAYKLARDFGYPKEAQKIFEAMELDVRFQLQTQFTPETLLRLHFPQQALGGFHGSLTSYDIRIDYVQHNISSMLCLRQLARP